MSLRFHVLFCGGFFLVNSEVSNYSVSKDPQEEVS